MGLLVRLVSGGIGLASEAIAANKASKERSKSSSSNLNPEALGNARPRSRSPSANLSPQTSGKLDNEYPIDAPPAYTEEYAELPREQAEKLISSGQAQLVTRHDSDNDSDSSSGDEAEWALDDATGDIEESTVRDTPTNGANKQLGKDAQLTVKSLSAIVLATCLPPPYQATKLPHPVILPQRRPGENARGFVRAYAPLLEDNGISQESFLSFIKNMHVASKASPVLTVVTVSAVASTVASDVVQVAVGSAIELQKRTRSNSFLDEMNEKLFQPRGLYALVLTYDPEAVRPVDAQLVDVTSVFSDRSGAQQTRMRHRRGQRRLGGGTTYRELEMPEAAPLVFPVLEEAVQRGEGNVAFKDKIKKQSKFMADYYDRRAQATYSAQNPPSSLQLPGDQAPKFASRFADPNHAVNSGSPIALITGGLFNPRAGKAQRKAERRERKYERREAKRSGDFRRSGEYGRPSQQTYAREGEYGGALGRGGGESSRGPAMYGEPSNTGYRTAQYPPPPQQPRAHGIGGKKARRAMKQDVLYLMIVNMPSQEELAAAGETLRATEKEQAVYGGRGGGGGFAGMMGKN